MVDAAPAYTTLPGAVPVTNTGGLGALPGGGAPAAQPDWLQSLGSIFGFGQNQTPQAPGAAPGAANPLGGAGAGVPIGANIGTGQLAIGGLSALGNLWTAWNATNLAKQSFQFNKTLATDNYANQSEAYNTNLQNIATSRGVAENQTPGQVQNYIAGHSVKTTL